MHRKLVSTKPKAEPQVRIHQWDQYYLMLSHYIYSLYSAIFHIHCRMTLKTSSHRYINVHHIVFVYLHTPILYIFVAGNVFYLVHVQVVQVLCYNTYRLLLTLYDCSSFQTS